MRRLNLFFLSFLLFTGVCLLAQKKYSEYPNTSTLKTTDLFLIADPGVTNRNITWNQLKVSVPTIGDLIAKPGADTNLQYDVKGYSSINDGGGGAFEFVVDDGTGTNLGTVFRYSLNTNYLIKRIYSSPINAAWFGAKGNNDTDESDNIQAALNEAINGKTILTSKVKNNVFLPSGVYWITNTIYVPAGVGFIGENSLSSDFGSILHYTNSIVGCVLSNNSSIQNIGFINFNDGATTSKIGVKTSAGAFHWEIDNCFFKYLSIGIYLENCAVGEIRDCSFYSDAGIIGTNSYVNAVRITGGVFDGGKQGIYFYPITGVNNIEIASTFEYLTNAISFYGDASGITIRDSFFENYNTNTDIVLSNSMANIKGCTFQTAGTNVNIITGGPISIKDCKFHNNNSNVVWTTTSSIDLENNSFATGSALFGLSRLNSYSNNVQFIITNGLVGIQKYPSSSAKLQVNGDIDLLNGIRFTGTLPIIYSSGYTYPIKADGSYVLLNSASGNNTGVGAVTAPNSKLHVAGPIATSVQTGGNATLGETNSTYLLNVNGETVTLPTAVGKNGRIYVVKLIAPAASGVVNPASAAELIEGTTTYSLSASNKYVVLQADHVAATRTNWWIIGNN